MQPSNSSQPKPVPWARNYAINLREGAPFLSNTFVRKRYLFLLYLFFRHWPLLFGFGFSSVFAFCVKFCFASSVLRLTIKKRFSYGPLEMRLRSRFPGLLVAGTEVLLHHIFLSTPLKRLRSAQEKKKQIGSLLRCTAGLWDPRHRVLRAWEYFYIMS